MGNPILFREELADVVTSDEQLKRILKSEDSEDLLTWNLFALLAKSKDQDCHRWLLDLLSCAFPENDRDWVSFLGFNVSNQVQLYFWRGRRNREFYPPKERNEWQRNEMLASNIKLFRDRASKGGWLEGPTEVDVLIETHGALIFIEAKYLSDIDYKTAYDLHRDQIIRNIDVGTYQAAKQGKRFFFILLTPEFYKHDRFYWFKMDLYQRSPATIKEKLPYRAAEWGGQHPLNFEEVSSLLGWILWRDVFKLAERVQQEEKVVEGEEWQAVAEDFQRKGLV